MIPLFLSASVNPQPVFLSRNLSFPPSQRDEITDESIKSYPPFYKFIAKRTQSLVPCLSVHTPEEQKLFHLSLPNYIGTTLGEAKNGRANLKSMLEDWNSAQLRINGRRKSPGPSVESLIFKKTLAHLDSYLSKYENVLEKMQISRLVKQNVASIKASQNALVSAPALFSSTLKIPLPLFEEPVVFDDLDEEDEPDLMDFGSIQVEEMDDESSPQIEIPTDASPLPVRDDSLTVMRISVPQLFLMPTGKSVNASSENRSPAGRALPPILIASNTGILNEAQAPSSRHWPIRSSSVTPKLPTTVRSTTGGHRPLQSSPPLSITTQPRSISTAQKRSISSSVSPISVEGSSKTVENLF
ncbi:hypothetical protein HDV05_002843 [Chytridiales sp. JEL 0842]|nr:hypothetical protein HDV05_002843 [Chytridiales sp. JEL 0842]